MQDMMHSPKDAQPQDDKMEDVDMIKSVLQKIIDEMDHMEADRITPMGKKPQVMAAKVDVMAPKDDSEMDGMSEPDADDKGLDPAVLDELMKKADSANDEGSLPEDSADDLDPEIADIVKKKKMGMKPA